MNAVRRHYPAAGDGTEPAGHDSDAPIFIVGLPRTGTTLAERIVATHGGVFAAGELNDFAVSLTAGAKALSSGSSAIGG